MLKAFAVSLLRTYVLCSWSKHWIYKIVNLKTFATSSYSWFQVVKGWDIGPRLSSCQTKTIPYNISLSCYSPFKCLEKKWTIWYLFFTEIKFQRHSSWERLIFLPQCQFPPQMREMDHFWREKRWNIKRIFFTTTP